MHPITRTTLHKSPKKPLANLSPGDKPQAVKLHYFWQSPELVSHFVRVPTPINPLGSSMSASIHFHHILKIDNPMLNLQIHKISLNLLK